MKRVSFLLLLITSTATYASEQHDLCRTLKVPFAQTLASGQLLTGDLGFISTGVGSSAFFTILNRTTKPLTRVAILVEFRDRNDHFVMAIPLSAETTEETRAGELPLTTYTRKLLQAPVLPSESLPLVGAVQLSSPECPARAVASLVDLKFADGSQLSEAATGWRQTPSVTAAAPLQLESFPKTLPAQLAFALVLDARGKMVKVVSEDEDLKVTAWLRRQVSAWSFSPATVDGKSVPSEVHVLLRVSAHGNNGSVFDDNVFQKNGPMLSISVSSEKKSFDDQFVSAGGVPLVTPARPASLEDVPCPDSKCSLKDVDHPQGRPIGDEH